MHNALAKINILSASFKTYYFLIKEAYKNALAKILGYSILEIYFFRGNEKGIKILKNIFFNRSLFAVYLADNAYIDILFMRIKINIKRVVFINLIKILIGTIIIIPINIIFKDANLNVSLIIVFIIVFFFFDHDYYEYYEEEE